MNLYAYCGNNPLVFADPSGAVQKVTGNYWTMPAHLNPGMSLAIAGLRESAKLITNVLDLAPIPGDSNNPAEKIVQTYLEALEKLAELLPNLGDANAWKCFIEVYDTNDPDKKYWIEVQGFRMPRTKNKPADMSICWIETQGGNYGYQTQEQAADAGGSLVDYALKNGGVIPNKVPDDWLAPTYTGASSYITDKPYYSSDGLLYFMIKANDIAEKIRKIKEEIKNLPTP
jgi:hypothetical protein